MFRSDELFQQCRQNRYEIYYTVRVVKMFDSIPRTVKTEDIFNDEKTDHNRFDGIKDRVQSTGNRVRFYNKYSDYEYIQ